MIRLGFVVFTNFFLHTVIVVYYITNIKQQKKNLYVSDIVVMEHQRNTNGSGVALKVKVSV